MLKSRKMLLLSMATVSTFAAIGVFVSCGKSAARTETTNPKPEKDSIRVAVTDPDNARWISANNSLLKALEGSSQGGYANITKNQAAQNQFLETAITNKPKGLIIAPHDGTEVGSVVTKASSEKIPVVAYDRLIKNTDGYDWYVTYDNSKVGTLQGLALASGLLGAPEPFKTEEEMMAFLKDNKPTEKIGYYALGGSKNDNNAKLFYSGAKAVLDKLVAGSDGQIVNIGDETEETVLLSDWNYDEARKKMDTFFTTNDLGTDGKFTKGTKTTGVTLKGVLAPNDGMALSAVSAIEGRRADATKVYITGQDFNNAAVDNIKAGKQDMTIYKPDNQLATLAVKLLLQLIENKGKSETEAKNVDAIFAEVEKQFKEAGFTIALTLDKTQYESKPGRKINAILILPTVVTKTNVEATKTAADKAEKEANETAETK